MTPDVSVTIVIPNWNGEEVLPYCFASLQRQTFRDFHIILVDNGSKDRSLDMAEAVPLSLSVIRFAENRGFASAVNAGIDQSSAPYVLLLNNDVVLHPQCLERLVRFLDQHPHSAVATCRMMQWSASPILDSLGNGMSREGKGFQIGWGKAWRGSSTMKPFRVFGACAACALYRKTAFGTVGGMDTDFFAYLEDVDWSFRANWQGLKTFVVPSAVAYHKGSHTTGGHYNPFALRLIVRNQLGVLVKNYPLSMLIRHALFILCGQIKTAARVILLERRMSVYVQAIPEFIEYLPRLWRKRKEILRMRATSCSEMDSLFRESEKHRGATF